MHKHLRVFLGLIILLFACQDKLEYEVVDLNRPQAEFAIQSEANLVINSDYTVVWAEVPKAKSYSVSIASDPECTQEILRKDGITTTSLTLSSLNDGTYYICVFATIRKKIVPALNNGILLSIDRIRPVVQTTSEVKVYALPFDPEMAIIDTSHVSMVWSQTAGRGKISFADSHSNHPQISADQIGAYTASAEIIDEAGNRTTQNFQFIWDPSLPIFRSFAFLDAASDGYINAQDSLMAEAPVGELSAAAFESAAYVVVEASTACTKDLSYSKGAPTILAFTSGIDGTRKVCILLKAASGLVTVASSGPLIVDRVSPVFSSIPLAGEATDGNISIAEHAQTGPIVGKLVAQDAALIEYALTTEGTSCGGPLAYVSTIPKSDDARLTTRAAYRICLRLTDAAQNLPTYGLSPLFTYNSVLPTFGSLAKTAEGLDGYVGNIEKNAVQALWTLSAFGSNTTTYTIPLNDAGNALVCDGSKNYDQTSIATALALPSDGSWAICVKLDAGLGAVTYGKSELIIRDTVAPSFTSLVNASAASDGYLNEAERLLVSPAWTLTASGHSSALYTLPLADATNTVVCDAAQIYNQATVPSPSTFTVDGSFIICVQLRDLASNVTHGKSQTLIRDTIVPVFTSLAAINEASDLYINNAEKNSSALLFSLSASGFVSSAFSLPQNNSGSSLVCDSSLVYSESSLPLISSLTTDGAYAICVKLTDVAANVTYGKSASVIRDLVAPIITSVLGANEATDGYIGPTEIASVRPAWVVNGSGIDNVKSTALQYDDEYLTCDETQTYSLNAIPLINSFPYEDRFAICVKVTDSAGNIAYAKSSRVYKDTTNPDIYGIYVTNAANDSYINDSEKLLISPMWRTGAYDDSPLTYLYSVPVEDSGASLVCDASKVYNLTTIPSPSILTADGLYRFCALATDGAGNKAYKISDPVTRDTVYPILTSFNAVGVASDLIISVDEELSTAAVYSLVSSGSNYAPVFTQALKDSPSAIACDWRQNYLSTTVPLINSMTTDGDYAVCVKLEDTAHNRLYAKSQRVTRSSTVATTNGPLVFSSLDLIGSAADGFINAAERAAAASDLGGNLLASGYTTAGYVLVTSGQACSSSSLVYGVMPKSDSSALSVAGSYKICVKLDNGSGTITYGSSAVLIYDDSPPTFSGVGQVFLSSSGTDATVFWPVASDNLSLRSDMSYQICMSTIAGDCAANFTANFSVGANLWDKKITGLSPGTTYEFLVRAVDKAGNRNSNTKVLNNAAGPTISMLSVGPSHSCALFTDTTVKCWGSNYAGQLGQGVYTDFEGPATVPGLGGVVSVKVGGSHTCVLLNNGNVHCWGQHGSGQLGRGTQSYTYSAFIRFAVTTNAVAIELSNDNSCAILANGTAQCWGANWSGQVGDGTTVDKNVPTLVSGLSGVTSLTSADYHSCALLGDKTIRCWGYNYQGQLGNGTTTNSLLPAAVIGIGNASAISLGSSFSCAFLDDQTVKCWGNNSSGQLGNNSTTSSSLAVAVTGLSTVMSIVAGNNLACGLLSDQTVKCWGSGFGSTPSGVANLSGVLAFQGSYDSFCARLLDSTAKCWGNNSSMQLGDGTNTSSYSTAVVVAGLTNIIGLPNRLKNYNLNCFIISGQKVRCFGSTSNMGTNINASAPSQIRGLATVTSIATGSGHGCALLQDGTAKCWGSNSYGQLGIGVNGKLLTSPASVRSSSTDPTALANIIQVVSGADHSCALLSNGTVECWGNGLYGQLGDGTVVSKNSPVLVSGLSAVTRIAAGAYHNCAFLNDLTVKCWGYNGNGQLGNGNTITQSVPDLVLGLSNVSKISAGSDHSCATLQSGEVKCWGDNYYGQLGDGNSSSTNTLSPNLAVLNISNPTALSLGSTHSCAILSSGGVKCWGYNGGQTTNTLGAALSEYMREIPVNVNNVANESSLSAGYNHSCVALIDGTAKCWGTNDSYQLGNGSITASSETNDVLGLKNVTKIGSGNYFSCAVLSDQTVRCWGANDNGQSAPEKVLGGIPVL